VYLAEPMPIDRVVRATAIVCSIVIGGVACDRGAPTQTATPSSSAASPGAPLATDGPRPSSPSPSPTAADPTALHWYEVRRVHDLEGNETRALLVGSMDGRLYGDIALGSLDAAESEGGLETFAWTDPQTAGIFGDSILIWGRDGQHSVIETVDVNDASIATTVVADGVVQAATADASLSMVFFITVDDSSNQPTGLWLDSLVDGAGPRRIDYDFADRQLSRTFMYELLAAADGSQIAVRAGGGIVTVIDVASGEASEVDPRGPLIGFSEGLLIAFGQSGAIGSPVLAIDAETGEARELVGEASAAQVVPGLEGGLVAAMQIDPREGRHWQISVIPLLGGETWVAFTQDPAVLGAQLPRRDVLFHGVQLPPEWILLVDSFSRFITGRGEQPVPPESAFPRLLNLRTGEVVQIGPFVDETQR